MKLRGIRRRLSGWKLHRYVERCRYRILCAREKRRKKRPYTQSVLWTTAFRLESGDDEFARIISSPRELLKAGDETVICTRGSVVIRLPEVMDFEKNYEASARVLSIFRRALEAGKRISYIGFENLKEISPACIMAFSSYADIWKRRAPAVHTRCETWSPEVVDAFAQIGVFDMLHVRHGLTDVKNTGRRRYLPLRSCGIQTGEGHDVGTETKRLRKQIEEFTGRSLSRVRMYDSVTEAIFNVRNHAYKGMVPGRLPFRWWFSVSYDETANELGVILFDHGYGIPATMLRSTKFEKFRSFFRYNGKVAGRRHLVCISPLSETGTR